MLDNYVNNQQDVVAALRTWHITGALPDPPPDGVTLEPNGDCIVAYGFNGAQHGRLKFMRGQFELIAVTDVNNVFVSLQRYNHTGKAQKAQDYYVALKCSDLCPNQAYVSRMITLTSEASRSQLVQDALRVQFEYQQNLEDLAWGGMEFCFKNYRKTAEFCGYDIQAGRAPWNPLTARDYLGYIAGPSYTGDRPRATDEINALDAFASQ